MDQSKLNEKDQAENLRMQFSSDDSLINEEAHTEAKQEEAKQEEAKKIDILNLPKRQDIHKHNQTRTVLKLNKTLVRFIVVTIIILGMLIAGIWLNLYN